MQVVAEDANGNASAVTSDTSVGVTGKVPAALFTGIFSDSGCTQASVSVTIPSGSTTGTFYFFDKLLQQVTLSAVPASLTAGTLVVNVAPAPPSRITLSGFGY